MNPGPECDQELLMQAEFDAELDAAQSIAAQRHRRSCARCRQLYAELQQTSMRVREGQRFDAPAALRAKLSKQLDALYLGGHSHATRPNTRPRWSQILAGAVGGAAAATLAMLLLVPAPAPVAELMVDSHVRAQQSRAHLLDIASSEHHVVKPWFAGQLPFAPPVKDLATLGYPLQGARIDVLAGESVAVLVYQAGRHTIDVFIWPAARSLGIEPASARGFNLQHWSNSGLSLWAVSDLNSHELATFVQHWQSTL